LHVFWRVLDRLVLVPALRIRTQSRSACAGAHQTVYAHAHWGKANRQLPRTQLSPGRRLSAVRFGSAHRSGRLVFQKGATMTILGSARILRADGGILPSRTFAGRSRFLQNSESSRESSCRRNAETSTRDACAPQIIAITLCLIFTNAEAAALQERVDTAAPGETLRIEAGVHAGPIIINKSLTLIGEPGAEIRGNGSGKVVTVAADDGTLRGVRITGSGLQLSDDDAAVFVTGNRAKIENCIIADSLHGVYLKRVSGAQILNNRIQGKTTLAASTEPVEKGIGQSAENCDTTLVANRRGNGIHQ